MQVIINEIFASIQGEGFYAGMPAIFVRFQGCHVGCPFCDTKHSWNTESMNGKKMDTTQVYAKICELQKQHPAIDLLVITGGEPFEQPEALYALHALATIGLGMTVQVETSGYLPHDKAIPENVCKRTDKVLYPHICLSPKLKRPPDRFWYEYSDSLKILVDENGPMIPLPIDEITQLFSKSHLLKHRLFFQPVDTDDLNALEQAKSNCVKLTMKYGTRVSIQAHKYLGIR